MKNIPVNEDMEIPADNTLPLSKAEIVLGYHQRTKHRFDGYAAGPETIDWDDQPDPFRRFEGAPLASLPLKARELKITYGDLWSSSPLPLQPVTVDTIGQLLEMSLALSAWKQYGSARWSLRCNPSSGNLHPTEAYLIAVGVPGLADGIYHYRADCHGLEQRCHLPGLSAPAPRLWLAFSSVHWREAWKYGERAYRYCQHDVGHALAAVQFAAAVLGWCPQMCDGMADNTLMQLLGLDRDADFAGAEREHPDVLLALHGDEIPADALNEVLAALVQGRWQGIANVLDRHHFYQWPAIDAVTEACNKAAGTERKSTDVQQWPEPLPSLCAEPAASVFRRRRSAQGFDGETVMQATDFFRLLDHLLPRPESAPWRGLPWQPALHLVFFVHRVEGLQPGLYALARTAEGLTQLQNSFRKEFLWQKVEVEIDGLATEHLLFYQLIAASAERTAAKLCCQQPIAATSAFSLAMIADFESQVRLAPWRYRELFWEAGIIGQVLYLEAEACGLRGTGIGCYFDDPVHGLLGIQDLALQSLYHFTLGEPLVDTRIISLPPY